MQAFQVKQVLIVLLVCITSELVRAEELGITVLDEIAFMLLLGESE